MKTCNKCGSTWENGEHCPNCGANEHSHTAPVLALCIGAVLFLVTAAFMIVTMFRTENTARLPESVRSETEAEQSVPSQREEYTGFPQDIPEGCLGSGIYEVGVDIPAGEYVIITDRTLSDEQPVFYVSVHTDAEQTDENCIFGRWLFNSTIIRAEEGQFLEIKHAYMYESSQESLLKPFEKSGVFHVGRDIPAGTYLVTSTSDSYMGYFKVFDELTYELDHHIQHEAFSSGGSAQVTLSEGQYLLTEFCCLQELPPEAMTEETAGTQAAALPEGCFGEGSYQVGTDIPAGEYVVVSDGTWASEEETLFTLRIQNADGSEIRNGWQSYNTIVQLTDGQTVEVQHGYFYECSSKSLLDPFSIGGVFHVGRDVPAGTYTIVSDTDHMGYYRIFTDIGMSEESMRTQGPLYAGESTEIALNENEYLLMHFCHLQ